MNGLFGINGCQLCWIICFWDNGTEELLIPASCREAAVFATLCISVGKQLCRNRKRIFEQIRLGMRGKNGISAF